MTDEFQRTVFALRDLAELTGATHASMTWEDGNGITVEADGTVRLDDGTDITPLIDWTGMVVA